MSTARCSISRRRQKRFSVPVDLVGALARAESRLSGAVALVSGRRIEDIDRLFKPLRLSASGVHGAQIRRPRTPPWKPSRPQSNSPPVWSRPSGAPFAGFRRSWCRTWFCLKWGQSKFLSPASSLLRPNRPYKRGRRIALGVSHVAHQLRFRNTCVARHTQDRFNMS